MQVQAKERKSILSAFCLLLSLCVLSGCAYLRSPDTSTDNIQVPRTSATTDTKREACVRSCSRDHDVCNDGPVSRNETFDAPQTVVGAAAGCDKALRDCLRYCK